MIHSQQIPSLDEKLTVSGPYIVLLGCDSAQCIWRASVMIVTPPARGAVLPGEPSLMLSDQGRLMPAMASDPCQTDISILWSKQAAFIDFCCCNLPFVMSCRGWDGVPRFSVGAR